MKICKDRCTLESEVMCVSSVNILTWIKMILISARTYLDHLKKANEEKNNKQHSLQYQSNKARSKCHCNEKSMKQDCAHIKCTRNDEEIVEHLVENFKEIIMRVDQSEVKKFIIEFLK